MGAVEARQGHRETRIWRGIGELGWPAADHAQAMSLRPVEKPRDLAGAITAGDGGGAGVLAVQAGEKVPVGLGQGERVAGAVTGQIGLHERSRSQSRVQGARPPSRPG